MIHDTAFHGIMSNSINDLKFKVQSHISSNTTPHEVVEEIEDILNRLETLRLKSASPSFEGSYRFDGAIKRSYSEKFTSVKIFLPANHKKR